MWAMPGTVGGCWVHCVGLVGGSHCEREEMGMARRVVMALVVGLVAALVGASPALAAVSVEVDDGDLTITGTGMSEVVVVEDLGGGDFEVEVNGVLFPASGVTGNVKVDLKGGDDVFLPDPAIFPGDLVINTGRGEDVILLHVVTVGDDLTIRSGSGHDIVILDEVVVVDDTTVKTSSGDDLVSTSDGSSFGDRLVINTGSGGDGVVLDQTGVVGRTVVSTGGGDDFVVLCESTFSSGAAFKLGNGNDVISVEESSFDSDAVFRGQHGTDTFDDDGGNTFAVTPVIHSFEIFS